MIRKFEKKINKFTRLVKCKRKINSDSLKQNYLFRFNNSTNNNVQNIDLPFHQNLPTEKNILLISLRTLSINSLGNPSYANTFQHISSCMLEC